MSDPRIRSNIDIGDPKYDPAGALALVQEAGMADFEHELISIDDAWRKDTTDAVAAQLRDAGINVKRTVLPGSTFWNDWAKYPFSSTKLEPPSVRRADLGACLSFRRGLERVRLGEPGISMPCLSKPLPLRKLRSAAP